MNGSLQGTWSSFRYQRGDDVGNNRCEELDRIPSQASTSQSTPISPLDKDLPFLFIEPSLSPFSQIPILPTGPPLCLCTCKALSRKKSLFYGQSGVSWRRHDVAKCSGRLDAPRLISTANIRAECSEGFPFNPPGALGNR